MDFTTGKVKNIWILIGLIVGILLQIVVEKKSIIEICAGAIVPFLILIGVFAIGGIGAGDVKLFSVIGVFIGVKGVFYCIIVSLVLGAIFSLGKILIHRKSFNYFHNFCQYLSSFYQTKKIQLYQKEKANTIHFTLPIFISVVIYMGGVI
jgi:prepilin peptidase CpaA